MDLPTDSTARATSPSSGGRRAIFLTLCALLAACGGGSGGGGNPDALLISPAQLSDGTSGAFYGATLFATGGTRVGYAWDVVQGTLPPGLAGLPTMGSTAPLSGTLGAAGTYDFTVRLRDSAGAEVMRAYQVTVNPAGGGGGGGGGGGAANAPTSLTGAPSGRSLHTAVWTGTEMIVWGGMQLTGLLGDGGAYNPATDTWRAISSVGAPSPRYWHTAIWTGTEMIVWGGWDNVGPLASGAAYDPLMDSWRTLPTGGAPAARGLHTAVWTGSAMLVWGGLGKFPPPAPNSVDLVFGDGAAYDPLLNQWTALPAGGPTTRAHAAVWTGSRMIAWGGRDSFALTVQTLNVGGILDLAGGTWTATSQIGVPAARMSHTAVWTGGLMIVWGGQLDFSATTNTGSRFNPTSNTWSTTSVVGAPSVRTRHTAVWTGTEMAVWGGAGPGATLGDGAVYDPVTNSWRAFSAGFTPASRTDHTAVWTGSAMIVWGGQTFPSGAYLNTGAQLHP